LPRGDSDEVMTRGGILGPRAFYWAMMDYGAYLKKSVGNVSRASKSYTKQSTFHGSKRQLRGLVVRELQKAPITLHALRKLITDDRLDEVLAALEKEGMISKHGSKLRLG
jgi:A/G-specific adenine glycosylase